MTDKQQQWDQALGDKLRRLQPDYRAESWDALADRLRTEDADPAAAADAAIVAAIDKIEPRFTAESWDALADRLDAEEAAFDAEVSSAMRRVQPAYRSGSWAALAARLELEAYRRVSIWQTKSLELMTAFVLLLAFWAFFPYLQPLPDVPPAATSQPVAGLEAPVTPAAADIAAPAEAEDKAVSEPPVKKASQMGPASPKQLDQSIKQSALLSAASSFSATDAGAYSPKVIRPAATVDRLQTGQFAELAAQPSRYPIPAPRRVDSDAVTPLAATEVTAFAAESATPELTHKVRRTRSPLVRTWGVIGTHWDQNVVFTPSFTLKRTYPSATRLSRGSTLGVTYSLGRGRHRWESGTLYRLKQYFPSYVVRNDKRERSVNRMRYHSVSIPLSYQYALFRLDRWSAYLSLGASFNMTLAAHIDIEDIYLNSLSDPAGPRSEEARRTDNFGEHQGLLQGGKFSNNATLNTLLGAGLEYRWPGGLSLFVQPTVTRRIIDFGQNGEGPLLERINSNSVLFGFKREF